MALNIDSDFALTDPERNAVAQGFSVLQRADDEHLIPYISYAADVFANVSSPEIDEIVRLLSVREDEAKSVITATTSTYSLVVSFANEDVAAVLEAGKISGRIPEAALETARALIHALLPYGQDVRRRVGESRRKRMVPEIDTFSASIQVQLGFKDSEVSRVRPVAIFRLSNDDDEHLMFNVDEDDLTEMIENLQHTLENLRIAIRWSNPSSTR